MKTEKRPLRWLRRAGIVLLLTLLTLYGAAVLLFAWATQRFTPPLSRFDAASEGIVEVQTEIGVNGGKEEGERRNYVIAADRIMSSPDFAADPMTVYYVPWDCFESYIDHDQNKVLNRLIRIAVTDEREKPCDVPEAMRTIFPLIAGLEHDMMNIRIFDLSGEYFVDLETNVNLWSPCKLYYFDQETGTLQKLYTWDDERVLGIHILSADRLHGLGRQ